LALNEIVELITNMTHDEYESFITLLKRDPQMDILVKFLEENKTANP
jgi:hypothetical protein